MTLIDDLEEVEDSVKAAPAKRKRSWLPWVAVAGFVALLAAIVVNIFVPLPVLSGKAASELATQIEARDEICAFAPQLATYDYRDLEPYMNGVVARSTGDFKSQFSKGRADLTNWLKQGQVVSTVEGKSCGVDTSAGDLRIVIGLMQGVTSMASKEPAPATLSVVATVEKIDGEWKISRLAGPLLK